MGTATTNPNIVAAATTNAAAKIGAVFYVLWGVLHIYASFQVSGLASTLANGMVRGRIMELVWIMFLAGATAIVVGAWLNWKNDKVGFWLNAVVVSAVDIAFIFTVLVPGYAPLVPGGLGPLLWIIALAFTTTGYLRAARAS